MKLVLFLLVDSKDRNYPKKVKKFVKICKKCKFTSKRLYNGIKNACLTRYLTVFLYEQS